MMAPSEKRLFEMKKDISDKTTIQLVAQTITTLGYRLVILGSIVEVVYQQLLLPFAVIKE
jgi:hypothetical protein